MLNTTGVFSHHPYEAGMDAHHIHEEPGLLQSSGLATIPRLPFKSGNEPLPPGDSHMTPSLL